MTATRECCANGCLTGVPRHLLMCSKHWRMVPSAIQQRVYKHYRDEQLKEGGEPTDEWYAAAADAVEAVARAERKPLANPFRRILQLKAQADSDEGTSFDRFEEYESERA